jgi:two-component system sensor histidine kinase/response regulator
MESMAPLRSPINVDVALKRLNGDRTLLKAMAGFFLEDGPQLLVQLREGVTSSSFPSAIRAAHSLRGLASSFEATPVMELAGEIERLGRAGDVAQIHDLVGRLEVEVTRLTEALRGLTAT